MAIDSDERRVRAAKPLGAVELWLRDGDGWMRAPSKTSDQRSLVIPLTKFTTVAAGVVVRPRAPLCIVGGKNVCKIAKGNDPTGLCLESCGAPNPTQAYGFVTDGGAIFYLSHPTPASTVAVRYDLTTRLTTLSAPINAVYYEPSALDSDGSVWATGNSGNAQFRFGSASVQ